MTAQERFETLCRDDPRWAPHVNRYLTSYAILGELRATMDGPIVDVGGVSPFVVVCADDYGNMRATGDEELRGRDTLPGCARDSIAIVTCLEVIEHIKDTAEADREVWTGDGVRSVLGSIFRTLRPGGRLLLSTPNLLSWITLRNVLQGRHPFMWAPHPRELAPADVSTLLGEQGFTIDHMFSRPVWNRHGASAREIAALSRAIEPFAGRTGGAGREDCLFVVATKPRGTP